MDAVIKERADSERPGATRPARFVAFARDEALNFLEVFALCGFALVQPLLTVFGESPETFLVRGASTRDVIAFGLAIAFVPAVAVSALALCARLGGVRARNAAAGVAVGVLGFAVAMLVLHDLTGAARSVRIAVSAATGFAVGWARHRFAWARSYLRIAGAAPVIFLAMFLFVSPVAGLISGDDSKLPEGTISPEAPPVVLVVLDELPLTTMLDASNRIDASLFPNLAGLAGEATWFRNSSSNAAMTTNAVPTILTGRYARADDAPLLRNYPENLFTLLGTKVPVHGIESATRLCPTDVCEQRVSGDALGHLFGDAYRVYKDKLGLTSRPRDLGVDVNEVELAAFGRADVADDFVAGLERSHGPRLDYLHVVLPHEPWEYGPTGVKYDQHGHDGIFLFGWSSDRYAVALTQRRHLLQAMYADRLVGRVLDRLRAIDRFDDALVIVTADHGISFTPSTPIRFPTAEQYDEMLWVPLLVKAPGQTEGRVDDRNAQSIDILPTIADYLGVDLPWEVDGHSLRSPYRRDPHHMAWKAWPAGGLQPGPDGLAHLDAAAGFRKMLDRPPLVGSDATDPYRLYRLGEHGALVGRRVADLPVGEPSDLEVTLERRGRFRDVDPEDHPPLYVSGFASRTTEGVVFAVDGVVAGWSEGRHNPLDDRDLVYSLILPDLLTPGPHQLTAFELVTSSSALELRPAALKD